jgi:YgiT-type zinc finger domain-containing protein
MVAYEKIRVARERQRRVAARQVLATFEPEDFPTAEERRELLALWGAPPSPPRSPMTGHTGGSRPCPFCGGQLSAQLATIPFVLGKTMTVIEQVPAEVCGSCGEPFLHAEATDVVTPLLAAAVERLSTAR